MSDSSVAMGPRNKAVDEYYDVPAIQRKIYEKMARISRNEERHAKMFPGKEKPVNVKSDKT